MDVEPLTEDMDLVARNDMEPLTMENVELLVKIWNHQ